MNDIMIQELLRGSFTLAFLLCLSFILTINNKRITLKPKELFKIAKYNQAYILTYITMPFLFAALVSIFITPQPEYFSELHKTYKFVLGFVFISSFCFTLLNSTTKRYIKCHIKV